MKKYNIYVFGDSHAKCFKEKQYGNYKLINKLKVSSSIRGFKNFHSKTNYLNEIMELKFTENDILIFKCGQVDIECGYYYKKIVKKEKISMIDYMKETIEIYKNFLLQFNNKNIMVSSINLPSHLNNDQLYQYILFAIDYLNDNTKHNEIITLNDIDDLHIRTQHAISFNNMLNEMCNEIKIKFIDTTEMFLDKNTNRLYEKYQTSDHHYNGLYNNTITNVYDIFENIIIKNVI
jgi:hypothetical protein